MDVQDFDYKSIDWNLDAELEAAKNQFYRITLEKENEYRKFDAYSTETDDSVKASLMANLGS